MNKSNSGAKADALARVPQLSPEILHQVIQTRGLENCGELVAAATGEQLVRVLDLDLWRPDRPGHTEAFDAARFGVWLSVLAELGPAVAAEKLGHLDATLVIAGFAQHVQVVDRAVMADYEMLDGTSVPGYRLGLDELRTTNVGGYVVAARRPDAWEAVVEVLASLESVQPALFHQVIAGARALSNSRPEIDGLHDLLTDGEQVMFDVAVGREGRQGELGYVSFSDARAFLEMARRGRLETAAASPALVVAASVVPTHDELVYLANALVSGCSIQGRSFTPQEAWDAAVATCKLGLGSFQAGWTILHDDVAMYAADRLTAVLATLRCDDRHIQADLRALRRDMTKHMRAGAPWRARGAMEVLASLDMPAWAALLGLIDECPVLHAGIAASQERKTHAVSASAFEFISEQAQILAVRAFVESLPTAFGSPVGAIR